MKNTLLSLVAGFSLAIPSLALTPTARLGNMYLGPEWAHRTSPGDSTTPEESIDGFSLHAAAD